ncbi:MAG: hypothetical protein J6A05_08365 [Oscillospiraceae bacterium]|nr:hypothetical protein [Oscillospiraceae bacterium]
MKIKKIVAAIAAAAMAVTMTAVNAFAATVTLNSEYAGAWGASATIPKAEFAAIGGDVKVVLTVEQKKPLVGAMNSVIKPMNICSSWDQITWTGLTSDTAYAKADGFICVPKDCTTIEFVVPESVWSAFVGYEGEEGDGSAGLAFQANDVIVKSAELSAGAPQGEIKQISEEECNTLINEGTLGAAEEEAPAEEATTEEAPAEEATTEEAPAEEEATTEEAPAAEEEVEAEPAPETSTAPAATGNAPVAAIAVVMALAGAAAVASKKN